jgi:glycosyltransferase involved in cell wall biosynthesis
MPETSSPTVTVVVPSHNGATRLPAAIASIKRQRIDPGAVELIVVDDGSFDDTGAIAAELGARVVSLEPARGVAAARNAGVAAARAPVVAFTDDDCDCDETWLNSLLAPFADPAVGATGGRVRPAGPEGFTVRYLRRHNPLEPLSAVLLSSARPHERLAIYLRGLLFGPLRPSAGDDLYSVVGANMAFRRDLIWELGGFDEAFRFGGEEEDLCRRTHAAPHPRRIVFEPRAVISHLFVPRLRDTLRRSRAYGRGNARLAAKHRDVKPIVFPIPLLVLVLALAGLTRSGRRRGTGLLAPLVPFAAYPRWFVEMARAGSVEAVADPYVQLAQELLVMRGEVEGWVAGYMPQPARELVPDDAGGLSAASDRGVRASAA